MESIFGFAATVILISTSGVMSPGPLFAANIFYGLKGGTRAGICIACGHTLVEFPLVILLGLGALSLENLPDFRIMVGILGSLGLFGFAALQVRTFFKYQIDSWFNSKHSSFFAGIILSALNPFFIIWWFTIGIKLISDSLILWSIWGIVIMFFLHIWMDFAWLGGIAFLSSKTSGKLSKKNFRILILVLTGILVYFGFSFLLDALY